MNVADFFHWWFGQLREWIPRRWRRDAQASRDRLVVEVERGATRVSALIKGQRSDFGELPPEADDAQAAALRQFVADQPRRIEQLEFQIAPGQYLHREVDLPAAAEDNLDEAIGFQLDRLTPFDPQGVILRCGVASRDPVGKKLRAWLAVTPAARVERILGWLRDARPAPARQALRPEDRDAPLRLRYRLTARKRPVLSWALVLLNLGLLVAAASVHWQNREQQLIAVEQALSEVRRDAADAAALADTVERSRAEILGLRERRLASPVFTAVLEDLTQRTPDDTYLQRLEVRDGRVRLFGISAAASNLIGRLEDSPLLEGVRFESSVTRDAASGRERFSIVADLVAAPAAGAGS